MSTIKATINQPGRIQARAMVIGTPQRLVDLVDVDASQLDDGSVLIYETASNQFVVKNIIENDNTKIVGGSF